MPLLLSHVQFASSAGGPPGSRLQAMQVDVERVWGWVFSSPNTGLAGRREKASCRSFRLRHRSWPGRAQAQPRHQRTHLVVLMHAPHPHSPTRRRSVVAMLCPCHVVAPRKPNTRRSLHTSSIAHPIAGPVNGRSGPADGKLGGAMPGGSS